MKNGWTTHSSNNAIWLALSPFHMTMTCKMNKLEKPGGQLRIFHTLFGRSAAFYGHFWADTVMSEWFTRISPSPYSTKLPLSKNSMFNDESLMFSQNQILSETLIFSIWKFNIEVQFQFSTEIQCSIIEL